MCLLWFGVSPSSILCLCMGSGSQISTLKPIHILQNRAVKIISKTYHCQSLLPIYFRLEFLRFDDIVELQIASLCPLSITKFCQNLISVLPKWRIPISIALDLQQAVITTKLNVELKKPKELWPLFDQGYGVRIRVMWNHFHHVASKPSTKIAYFRNIIS